MKNLRKRLLSLGLSVLVSATIFVSAGVQVFAYTETTGTVTSDNVKVRSEASTTASQVSSLKNGDKVDIIDEAKDASGYVWYKIRVNKSETGFVRSDLLSKEGGSAAQTTTTTTNTQEANGAAATLPATTVTATESRTATITEDSVNVREGAGTGYNSVGKASKGETVTITGEATGSDNKTWYQVQFGNGKTGFIRSDLLQVSEAAPEPTPEVAPEGGEVANVEGGEGGEYVEAPVEEGGEPAQDQGAGEGVASEAGDGHYSLVYLSDDEGNPVWYLYDNIEGYRVKVNELIDAAKSSDAVNKLVKTNNNFKTILIILAVVIAALVVGLIILALKLRDSLYYEDEGEEFDNYSQRPRRRAREDEDDEEEPVRPARRSAEERTVRPNREESARPVRRERAVEEDADERPARARRSAEFEDERPARRSAEERPARRPSRDVEDERPVRRASRPQPEEQPRREEAPKRKARNFVGDEDDFEFEFLDLDDDK
jgi:uncharacterized protein YgiM (DUF1202 family)